ncbi:MAG: glycosyltransferase family 9 protein [Verrucomicrobiota bacterium]
MKILVISIAGIGDTLIATPLIHELRANYPDAVLDAFVLWPGSKDILRGNPHVNTVHQEHLFKLGKLGAFKYFLKLRRERYDITINAHPQSRMEYRAGAWLIGAPLRLSHQYDTWYWLDGLLVNRTLPHTYDAHSIANNISLLSLLNKSPKLDRHEFELFLSAAEEQFATDFLTQHRLASKRCVGFHVGSGATKNLSLKRWPLGHYILLIRRMLEQQPDVVALLFGGPDEREDHRRILAEVKSDRVLNVESKDIRQAAALIARCYSFISVDTSLMHMAAAVKVPRQIVIEAPTINKTNEPLREYFLVKNPGVNGRNLDYYRYDGHPIKGTAEELRRCMESVTVEAVYDTFLRAAKT